MIILNLSRSQEEGGMPKVKIFGIGEYGKRVAKSTVNELSVFKGSVENELLYRIKTENPHHPTDTDLAFFIGELEHYDSIIEANWIIDKVAKSEANGDIPSFLDKANKPLTIGIIAFDSDSLIKELSIENKRKLFQFETIFDTVLRISKNDLMVNLQSSKTKKQSDFLCSMAQKTIVTVINSFFLHAGIIGCDFADIKHIFTGHNTARLGFYKASDLEKAIHLAGNMIPSDLNKHKTGAVVIVITTKENKLELGEFQKIAELIQDNMHSQDADIILQYVCPKEHDDEIEISIIAISGNQSSVESNL